MISNPGPLNRKWGGKWSLTAPRGSNDLVHLWSCGIMCSRNSEPSNKNDTVSFMLLYYATHYKILVWS